MLPNFKALFDDDNFTIQSGVIPARARISGAGLGSRFAWCYSPSLKFAHRVLGATAEFPMRLKSSSELTCFWDTHEIEIFNPEYASSEFISIGLKPSPQLTAEFPHQVLGPSYGVLLLDDWPEPFKRSVQEDLDVIQGFVEPFRYGTTPGFESRTLARLAKEDLDLKLLWSSRKYGPPGQSTLAHYANILAAAPASANCINVTVNTKDQSNNPVSGCQVSYVKSIKHGKSQFYKSFSCFSTPTSECMYAGNYDMWAEKAGASGPHRGVNVASATPNQFVDLRAP